MFKNSILSISLFSLLVYGSAFGEHVLPVFSGSWFTHASSIDYDNCGTGMPIYQYDFIQKGTGQTIANELLKSTPIANCTWGNVYISATSSSKPSDFVGTAQDWSTLLESNAVKTTWERDCKTSSGDLVKQENITIQPHYVCPTSSRAQSNTGCTTTPDLCSADVVGRDFDFPDMGWLGHVGMTEPNWEVMEVLNDKQVIHTADSFSDFKTKTKYWGDVYSLRSPNKSYLDSLTALLILQTGAAQAAFDPKYTCYAQYHPGSDNIGYVLNSKTLDWEPAVTFQRAVFRCDTFVDYSYLAAANIYLPSSGIFLPKATYNSFSKQRYIGTKPTSSQISQNKGHTSYSGSNCFSALNDLKIQQLINNKKLPNSEKLNQLWELAQENRSDTVKYNYLIDAISFMKPITLETQLINAYQNDSRESVKNSLLVAMLEGVQSVKKAQLTPTDKEQILEVQQFLYDELQKKQTPFMLKNLIYTYAYMMPPEQSMALIKKKLKQLQGITYITKSGKTRPVLPKEFRKSLLIQIALMTPQSQERYLPELIAENKNDPQFAGALCTLLRTFPAKKLTPNAKTLVLNFLGQSGKPALTAFNQSKKQRFEQCMFERVQANLTAKTTIMPRHKYITAK